MKWLTVWLLLALGHLTASADVPSVPTKRVQADMGPGCKFTMKLPMVDVSRVGGDAQLALGGFRVEPLPKSWKSSFGSLYFDLYCKPSEGPGSMQTFGMFDRAQSRWAKNVEVMRQELLASGDRYQIELAERIIQTTQIHDIKAINAQGWAETFEDITGEEAHRERRMNFCVFNLSMAVCGIGSVAYLADGPKGDLTPHVLKIIRSIEFLPDEPLPLPPDSTVPAPGKETPASR